MAEHEASDPPSRFNSLDLLRVGGVEAELVGRSELVGLLPPHLAISERQLTTLITEGVIPRPIHFGEKDGVYPKITLDLLATVGNAMKAGVHHPGLRKLAAVWLLLQQGAKARVIDLGALGRLTAAMDRNALMLVPWLLAQVVNAPETGERPLLRLPSGENWSLDDDGPLPVQVVVGSNPDEAASQFGSLEFVLLARPLPRSTVTFTYETERKRSSGAS